jgi:hypothetical protein
MPFVHLKVGKAEFLGRAVGRPSVQLSECDYKVPSLEWFQIYRGSEEAGELLATFEMFEVSVTCVTCVTRVTQITKVECVTCFTCVE